ncbi:MAG: glycogen synthase [Anaerolineales bacterium]
MNDALKVLFVAAEAAPFVKVGGLADSASALPKALRRQGVDARLLIPRYGHLRSKEYDFHRVGHSIPVPLGPAEEQVHLLQTTIDDLPVYLIWDNKYFSAREKVYGFNDDPQRFTFFSRAVIAAMKELDWQPDIVHAHDWHTAPVITWLKVYGKKEPSYRDMATLYTIHNLAYQGICGRLILTFGRMDSVPHLDVEPPGQLNWMAQGIAHADLISTVSPTYAREILTGEDGMGLESLLKKRREDLFGILNGIDTDVWDPAEDTALAQTFDVDSLRMRSVNKAALQREAGLPARSDVPLLGVVSRLDRLKGIELLISGLESLLELEQEDVQVIILGTGDPDYEQQLRDLQTRFPERVRVYIRFDDRLARRIYGGVDLFLMPSLSEPGALGQMIAMRYGAVPVVRATGGLADAVLDADAHPSRGTGFVFEPYEVQAFVAALERALKVYRNSSQWQAVQRRAMTRDFSWDNSAKTYVDLYRRALAVH